MVEWSERLDYGAESHRKVGSFEAIRQWEIVTFLMGTANRYEGCSKNNVTFTVSNKMTCSALQNTLHLPEYTFLADQSIFGSHFHAL